MRFALNVLGNPSVNNRPLTVEGKDDFSCKSPFKMKYLLFIGFLIGLTNCSVRQDNLSDIPTIKKTFSKGEIQDLQLLYDFFNQSICESQRELDDCYETFFKTVRRSADSVAIYLPISFEHQREVYEKFEDSTFHEIWVLGKQWTREYPNDTLKVVYFNSEGKFMDFLKEEGKSSKFIKNYYESVETWGSPPPSLIAGIMMNYDKLGINDIKIKFVIAIHYLTLNDLYKRKEKVKNSG